MSAGYSGTPLAKKLGIKPGSVVFVSKPPANYKALVAPLPDGAKIASKMSASADIAHLFCESKAQLTESVRKVFAQLKDGGAIWISVTFCAARPPPGRRRAHSRWDTVPRRMGPCEPTNP